MTGADFEKVAAAIRTGEWRKDSQCTEDWVGKAVAKALGLNLKTRPTRPRCEDDQGMAGSGALVEVTGKDAKRDDWQFVEVAEED